MPDWLSILKAYVDTLETAIGAIEGATTLHNKLTAARALLLDQITAVRMAELDAANLPADIDTLLTRLTALRAGYLDELAAANIPADVDTLLARLTALRAGYLDELGAANIPADIDTLLARLTALRAGYLDELDFDLNARLGAPAGASISADLLTIDNLVDDLEAAVGAIEGATTLHNKLTAARAALLDQITAVRLAELDAANLPADIDTLLARLTAARSGYMDFETRVLEVSITAAANAGVTTVATVATQPCQIESIVIHADAAQTANMTTCAVLGGVGQVVTFIGTADATQANLNAADKQVGWTGAVRLAATKTIVINLVGTGAAAVDLTIVIKYRACVAGGSLS